MNVLDITLLSDSEATVMERTLIEITPGPTLIFKDPIYSSSRSI